MNKNIMFFDEENEWQKEWKGMPEYIQKKQNSEYHKITIRFENKEDLESFCKLINQKITNKTKSIWFPELERGVNANKIYVAEN